jgi:hypothetical protein
VERVEGSNWPPRGRVPPEFDPGVQITPRMIKAAHLSPEDEARAFEVMAAQAAYLSILAALDYVVDPAGTYMSLAGIPAGLKVAIAYHLARKGFRQTGPCYITEQPSAPVGEPAPPAGQGWHTTPNITWQEAP